ncbi:MAG: hypothetical protein ACI854_000790 [Arenicella sp.]|jgi:hypothetical protein
MGALVWQVIRVDANHSIANRALRRLYTLSAESRLLTKKALFRYTFSRPEILQIGPKHLSAAATATLDA